MLSQENIQTFAKLYNTKNFSIFVLKICGDNFKFQITEHFHVANDGQHT